MLSSVARKLRSLQLFYHSAHNHVKGASFAGDHELFGSFYPEAESDYDAVVERGIAIEGASSMDLVKLLQGVSEDLASAPSEVKKNSLLFAYGMTLEKQLSDACDSVLNAPITEGTRQLVGDVLNHMEARVYKIKQRMRE